jgi:signal transduction histidine kinase/ligand-binding sensor domain-containing protein
MVYTHKNKLIVILSFLSFLTLTNSFCEDLAFDNVFYKYSTRDGLSQEIIRAITQDDYGYLWIGTENGLNRYDGYIFKVFYNIRGDSNSLPGNNIYCLLPSMDKGIWVGTKYNGLAKYHPGYENFSVFKHDSTNENTLSSNQIQCLLEDSDGNLWVGTADGGLNHLNIQKNTIKRYNHDKRDLTSLPSNNIIDLAFDDSGKLWIRTDIGVSVFDSTHGAFRSINLPGAKINADFNSTFYIDKDSVLWLSTTQGLAKLDLRNETIYLVNESKETQHIIEIIPQDDENLLLADYLGVYLFNKKTFAITAITKEDFLPANSLTLFKDRTGSVWIGSVAFGLYKINLTKNKFGHYKHEPGNANSIASNTIRSLMVDSKNNIWVGFITGGMDVINPSQNTVTHYSYNPSNNNKKFIRENVTCMMEYLDGSIWLGTWGAGLYILPDDENKSMQHIQKHFADADLMFQKNIIQSLATDRFGNVLIGKESGLEIYNPASKESREFNHNPNDVNSLPNNSVQSNCIVEDIYGNFWIGTIGGLVQMIPADTAKNSLNAEYTFIRYLHDPEVPNSISNDRIISMYYNKDHPNTIYAGTFGGGLNIIHFNEQNPSESEIQILTGANGLPDNVIFGILGDRKGNIWMSTNYGLSSYDPNSGNTKNFLKSHGLQGNQFFWGASCHGNNGDLLFGGVNGFNIFNPEEIVSKSYKPDLVFTRFLIHNKPVKTGQKFKDRFILEYDINDTELIKLSHTENFITFEFAALHYISPDDNLYKYQLVGLDNDWIETTSKNRSVTYSNLPPGKYIFRVKGSSFYGNWVEKSIQIEIAPPFYRTLWFRILVLIIVLLLLYGLHLFRTRYIQRQRRELQRLVKERTAELNELNEDLKEKHEEILAQKTELQQHREHLEVLVDERTTELVAAKEKAEESDKLKTAFLLNMSHEIRTPLNAIVGFSGMLQSTDITDEEKEIYGKYITSNSESLIILIDDILDLSQIQAGQLKIRNTEIDVDEFLKEIGSYWQVIIKEKKLDFKLHIQDSATNLKVFSDKQRVKQILSNLINNACKFTEVGYIELGLEYKKDSLLFYVKDTGIGISNENTEVIFDRFRKITPGTTKLYRGKWPGPFHIASVSGIVRR